VRVEEIEQKLSESKDWKKENITVIHNKKYVDNDFYEKKDSK